MGGPRSLGWSSSGAATACGTNSMMKGWASSESATAGLVCGRAACGTSTGWAYGHASGCEARPVSPGLLAGAEQ